ncbi:MAG TPA: hypothetical protein VD866_06900, partial [Urbifossiella sp.]|nr:hypothetical protein [Urbifossiella sp.]
RVANRDFNLEVSATDVYADTGPDLDVTNIKRDVELYFAVPGSVQVGANGNVAVTYLTAGGAVKVQSRNSAITAEHVVAGPAGDVWLHAHTDLRVAAATHSGDAGAVRAGRDVRLQANGTIASAGEVTAGRAFTAVAHGDVAVSGPVRAGATLDVASSQGRVQVAASLFAGGALTLTAATSLTTAAGFTLSAGGDMTLRAGSGFASLGADMHAGAGTTLVSDVLVVARGNVTVAGDVTATGDITVRSLAGDVTVAGDMTAGYWITLDAWGAVTTTGELDAGEGINIV